MRQAGRSLPEYRRLRGEGSILDAIQNPDLAAELTLQPVRRYGVDAAILYSDIMVPVFASGFGVEIVPGTGPVIDNPFTSQVDMKRLDGFSVEQMDYVGETIRILAKELTVPLIGFTGAPFTVASYLVEGKPSRTWTATKALMHNEPKLWHQLMERLTEISIETLRYQIETGASAVQIFDSWIGCLSATDFEIFVAPHLKILCDSVKAASDAPLIYFGTDTAHLFVQIGQLNCDVVGVDWRTPIDDAWKIIGDKAIQGNLDPALCATSVEASLEASRDVLIRVGGRPGHIFNLGHGVLPETDPAVLEAIVAFIHEETSRG